MASDRIAQSFLLNRLPVESRLYLWPFLIGYIGWILMAAWYTFTYEGGFNELLLIPLALLGLGHFLTGMSVFWSVKADAWLACRRVPASQIEDAEMICVIPKEHNGKAAIVSLSHENDKISFKFHQETFYWDEEKKRFDVSEYPDQLPFSLYRKATGLASEEALKEARDLFGPNK